MKPFKTAFTGLVVAVLLLSSCGSDTQDAVPPEEEEAASEEVVGDIIDVAVSAGQFPTLVAAVQAAGLVETLKGEGPFTVFAPTEEAFANALAALGLTAEQLLADPDTLTAVLTYHVIPGTVMSSDLIGASDLNVATVNGAEVVVNEDMGTVSINSATVVTADIETSNGVIHVINQVLLPAVPPEEEEAASEEVVGDIIDVAVSAGQFPTLVAAVQAAGLVETLKGEGPFTVFAPTEEAFANALAALGLTAEQLLADPDTLTAVLTYHVIPGTVMSSDLIGASDLNVATVNGAEVVVNEDMGTVSINSATVVTADIETSNGVIHVINQVLLP
ncbi:MAG: fasciclin domain-containing protein [Candidatus Poriferisodalaceae bacterium]